jgi:hypothetical protein
MKKKNKTATFIYITSNFGSCQSYRISDYVLNLIFPDKEVDVYGV